MPTVSVDKASLFQALGDKSMTSEKFVDLCFDFGIELDDETEDAQPQLKIDIPANRYDMLCFEGIAMNLNVFLENQKLPTWTLKAPKDGQLQQITLSKDTTKIRPFVSGAVLRGIKFTQERYESFISLQDKLHQNIARQRSLVAIGTHDLDTLKGPFTYEALPPEQISFIPLNQQKKMTAQELMTFYEKDPNLNKYLPIIRDSPLYPVFYDANRTVLSMPPIINGDHSKITVKTRNVFIEMTATDQTKLEIVNRIMVTMFSCYCDEPFTIEPINIISPHNNQTRQTPDIAPRSMQASALYINSCCGLTLPTETICKNLTRMGYVATSSATANPSEPVKDAINVAVPPTRADVLHQADIMEDAAIAYGFNILPRTFPTSQTQLFSAALPINKLGDIVRLEAAYANWTEGLSLVLCSHDENYGWLRRKDDGTQVVRLQNPQTQENQIVRTSLIPGLLKCVRENKHHGGPIKFFEVSDVVFKDPSRERKTRNERHFSAVWYDQTSGFEAVQGLLDRVMGKLKIGFSYLSKEEKLADRIGEYWIEEADDPMFFTGRGVSIHVELPLGGKKTVLGCLGTLHPFVLDKFELPYPVSVMEINLEPLL